MANTHSADSGSLFRRNRNSHHHHVILFFYDFISSFRFTGKMVILMMTMLVLTVIGNVWNATNARTMIREEIITGLTNQVTTLYSQLNALDKTDQAQFVRQAENILLHSRWEADNSGYAFLTDNRGNLLVYPPAPDKAGAKIPPIQIKETNETLTQAIIRVAQSGQAQVVYYDFKKPGGTVAIPKAVYILPFGHYVISSGTYLDRAEDVFRSYIRGSSILLIIMLVVIWAIIQLFSGAIHEQVQNVRISLKRLSQRNLIQPPTTSAKRNGHDEFAQINREIENTRHQLSSLLRKECDMAVTLGHTAEEIYTLANKIKKATTTVQRLTDQYPHPEKTRSPTTTTAIAQGQASDLATPPEQSADSAKNPEQICQEVHSALAISEQIINQLLETSQRLTKQARSIDDTVHSYTLDQPLKQRHSSR